MPQHLYSFAGFVLDSDLELPLLEAPPGTPPDAGITLGGVPETLGPTSVKGPVWEATRDNYLLRLPRRPHFLVTGGRSIVVDTEPSVPQRRTEAFLLGPAIAALALQRGRLSLHASAVEIDGACIAIAGATAAGKSTLAAELVRRGHRLVAEDVLVLEVGAGKPLLAQPGPRHLNLTPFSARQLGFADEDRLSAGRLKGRYLVPQRAAGKPIVVRALCMLAEARRPLSPGVEPLAPAAALQAILANLYRADVAFAIRGDAAVFREAAGIVTATRVVRLARPVEIERVDEAARHAEALAAQ